MVKEEGATGRAASKDAVALHPAYFGLAALYVWRLWISNHNAHLPEGITWQWFFGFMSIGLACAAVWAIARRGRRALAPQHVQCGIAALAMAASTACVAASDVFSGPAAVGALGTMLGGFGLAAAYLQWGRFFLMLDLRHLAAYLFGGCIVASVLKLVLFALPAHVAAVPAAILPCVSAACLMWACDHPPVCFASMRRKHRLSEQRGLWKVLAVIAVFSLTNSVLLTVLKGPAETSSLALFLLGRAVEIVFSAAFLAWVFVKKGTVGFAGLWRCILFAFATVLLVNTIVGSFLFEDALLSASFNFITLFVWFTCVDVARRSSASATAVLGLGWLAYALPLFLGSFVAGLFPDGSEKDTVMTVGLLYIMAIAVSVCLASRDQDTDAVFDELNAVPALPEEFLSIDQRCEAVGRQRGLTPREIEIMQMMCKGRSKAYIAETLFIAESTVKGHSKSLYAKLDVHSRRELQELIGV